MWLSRKREGRPALVFNVLDGERSEHPGMRRLQGTSHSLSPFFTPAELPLQRLLRYRDIQNDPGPRLIDLVMGTGARVCIRNRAGHRRCGGVERTPRDPLYYHKGLIAYGLAIHFVCF
jgi:hypothetical protein